MKPVKVEFQAFGTYAGHETVDFTSIAKKGLFLICGKTGIGKTMILDAMTFALFGKSSGHGRDDFEAMRCTKAEHNAVTFVKFEFENNGEYYLFERRLERKRKNLSASYNVSQKDEAGVWQPLMENPKDKALNEKAVEIIGLEYEQFRQVIILPQGQFERLLTSNSDEKEKILTSIFGEERWQKIAENFYEKAEKRKNELKTKKDRIQNSLLEENCESTGQLLLLVEQKKEQEAVLDKEYQKADYDRIVKERQEQLILAKRFGDLHKAERRVEELLAEKEVRAGWEQRVKDAERAEKVRNLIEAEQKAQNAWKKRQTEEEAANNTADRKKKEAETASERVKAHAGKEKEIDALRRTKIRYEGKRGDYEGLEAAEKEYVSGKKAEEDALKTENEARRKSEAFAERIVTLQTEFSALQKERERLLNAYLAGITGELASQLVQGKPCPVCGSIEHPHKAEAAENGTTRAMVDAKKKEEDQKYEELQKQAALQEKANAEVEKKHAEVERIRTEVAGLGAQLESRKKNLEAGISTALMLEKEIRKLRDSIEEYEQSRERLAEEEKKAVEAYTEARTRIDAAEKETKAALEEYRKAKETAENGLKEHQFASGKEAEQFMLSKEELKKYTSFIADYDANVKAAKENREALLKELKEKEEPDEKTCQEELDRANNEKGEYREKKAVLSREVERLDRKLQALLAEGDGIEEKIREAEEDFVFAKKLRGDSGTGLRRYVLGIMFSSVVTAANQMLEKIHGGRYRLYRSDEKAQGTNKRGLELKVFDKHSEEHDGRFVSTLSGGEKFLASLALSIGMSAVAQKSGIKIEALFIDEGFGSLDEESITDAMEVLNSIQEANGLVGIISHVQILQDQIPSKLRVISKADGSHIVRTVG